MQDSTVREEGGENEGTEGKTQGLVEEEPRDLVWSEMNVVATRVELKVRVFILLSV